MRFIRGKDTLPRLELTRRNLVSLLVKLDQPGSARTLIDPDHQVEVTAVEDSEHYSNRPPGEVADLYPALVVTVVTARHDDDGAQYTLIYPDGKQVPLGDAEDNYSELAGIIDDEYDKVVAS